MTTPGHPPVLALRGVGVDRDGRALLDQVDWTVREGDHWVVVGPNGSGKSTLVGVATCWTHPSRGTVNLLGHRLGTVDLRPLRARVGLSSAALADALRPHLSALDVVVTGRTGALEPWWHTYADDDRARARVALDRVGLVGFAGRRVATLSSGERQRLLLARALAADPALVVLDEPTAGLDLGGREQVVGTLESLAAAGRVGPPTVLVTHHLEDVPRTATHALVLAHGRVLAAGAVHDVLTGPVLSRAYGLDLDVRVEDGRWRAVTVRS